MLNLKVDSSGDILMATVEGRVTVVEALEIFKKLCDVAAERRLARVLVDYSAAEGELSDLERYELGSSMADYYLNKSASFKIATVGRRPLIDGLAAQVASNRGLAAAVFSNIEEALAWLNAFRSAKISDRTS